MLCLLLFGCLLSSVEGRDRLADRAFFLTDPIPSFIPAYPLDGDGRAYYNWEVRNPHFKIVPKTKFHVSWNPLKCDNEEGNHQLWVSFLEDWLPGADVEAEDIKKHSFSFTFKALSRKPSANSTRRHFYHISGYSEGKSVGHALDWPFSMQNAGFFVELKKGYARISVYFQGSYKKPAYQKVTDIPENMTYMAIFGNQQFTCPVFISAIDKDFPIWLPGMPITKYVKGRKRTARPEPFVLSYTIIAAVIIGLVAWGGKTGYFQHFFAKQNIFAKLAKKNKDEDDDADFFDDDDDYDDGETKREGETSEWDSSDSSSSDSEDEEQSLITARSPNSVAEEWGIDVSYPIADSESSIKSPNLEDSTQDQDSVREAPIELPADSLDTTRTTTKTRTSDEKKSSDENTRGTKSITPEDVPKWV